MRSAVLSAADFMRVHVEVSEIDAGSMALSTSPTAVLKSAIAASTALRLAEAARVAASRCKVIAFAISKLMTRDRTRTVLRRFLDERNLLR